MTEVIPTVGRIVLYTLTKQDVDEIDKRREDAARNREQFKASKPGYQTHVGNPQASGERCAAIIVRAYPDVKIVNLQVFLDGNDTLWKYGIKNGIDPEEWMWPPRAPEKVTKAGEPWLGDYERMAEKPGHSVAPPADPALDDSPVPQGEPQYGDTSMPEHPNPHGDIEDPEDGAAPADTER